MTNKAKSTDAGKKQNDHKSNMGNDNKGTKGTNTTYDKVHGNRGKQLNPNKK